MSVDVLPPPTASCSKAYTSKQAAAQLISAIFPLATQLASSSYPPNNSSTESLDSFSSTTTTMNSPSNCQPSKRFNNTHRTHHHHHNDFRFSSFSSSSSQPQINKMALTVLARVHRWCCQLFWLTIVCFIGICGEQQQKQQQERRNFGNGGNGLFGLDEVRKSLKLQASQRHGSKKLQELEAQLLRHLTRPKDDMFHQRISNNNSQSQYTTKPKIYLSCPPSPRLFKISEEGEF
uniref:Uncharacterized protein n=1 Tax=Meloidogyne incognita TaxID=6306 RepID=A0A914NH37_MELIC